MIVIHLVFLWFSCCLSSSPGFVAQSPPRCESSRSLSSPFASTTGTHQAEAFTNEFQQPLDTIKPLTSTSRRLKEMELHLLRCFEDSDEAIHWSFERVVDARMRRCHTPTFNDGTKMQSRTDFETKNYSYEKRLTNMTKNNWRVRWNRWSSCLAILLFTKGHHSRKKL
jgi:hypothetical protein